MRPLATTPLAGYQVPMPAVTMVTSSTQTVESTATQTATYTAEPYSYSRVIAFAVVCGVVSLTVLAVVCTCILKRKKPGVFMSSLVASEELTSTNCHQKPPTFSIIERLGWPTILTLLAGILFEAAALAFLSLFWSRGIEDRTDIIHYWTLTNNLPRIVAVSSYILRLSISAHSTAGISMLAAITLEQFVATITKVPELLANVLGQGSHHGLVLSFLPIAARTLPVKFYIVCTATILAGLFFTLQLSSTILLSDVGLGNLLAASTTNRTLVAGAWTGVLGPLQRQKLPYVAFPPTSFALFAEKSSPVDGSLQGAGFDFTGNTSRAFLPFSSASTRQSLGSYSGYMTVLDASTLCVAPPLSSLRFQITPSSAFDGLDYGQSGYINGSIDWAELNSNLSNHGLLDLVELTLPNRTFSIVVNHNSLEGCYGREWRVYMFSVNSHRKYIPGDTYQGLFGFFNISNPTFDDLSDSEFGRRNASLSDFLIETDGPWTTLKMKNRSNGKDERILGQPDLYNHESKEDGIDLALTICISGHKKESDSSLFPVTYDKEIVGLAQLGEGRISSTGPITEPTITSKGGLRALDVSQLLTWLGVAPEAQLETRSVLKLEEMTPWKSAFISLDNHHMASYSPTPPQLTPENFAGSFLVCSHDNSRGPRHYIYTAVIQKILETTGRPALAAQAFITILYQSLYYDALPMFDISANAQITKWVLVSIPLRRVGFITVCALTAAHTLVVLGILIAFISSTKYSKLRDPWSIFAYASSGELAEMIEEAKRLGATDHVKVVKEQGMENELVGLGFENGEIGIRKRVRPVQDSGHEDSE
ncbi:hypothetical protein F5Y04DRAFT_293551 [Hypomontagnella monticulosa]|nr:hypothetical protein F5Y04DRAFT_293551 [Hypomontagnella monticulosa]